MWKWCWPRITQESKDDRLKREFDQVFKNVAKIVVQTDVEGGLMHISGTITHEGILSRLSMSVAIGPIARPFDEAIQALRDQRPEEIPLDDLPPGERGH